MSCRLSYLFVMAVFLSDCENRYKLSVAKMRETRKDLEGPEGGIDELANSFTKSGKGLQCHLTEVGVKK